MTDTNALVAELRQFHSWLVKDGSFTRPRYLGLHVLERVLAALAECSKDTERLDWLQTFPWLDWTTDQGGYLSTSGPDSQGYTLREAIDAARNQESAQ